MAEFHAGNPGIMWTGAGSTMIGYKGGPEWMYRALMWPIMTNGRIQLVEPERLQDMIIRRSQFSKGPSVATVYGMRAPMEEIVWVDGLPFIDDEAPNRVSKEYM
ncbi:MAG: hypothetical protein EBZ77_09840 [Chitinophagia bacterium]|nr:hypothetical protein [Chitinophagia bacterium]